MINEEEVSMFLQEWRTRREVEERFNLSNSESYHLLRWLKKAKSLEMTSMNLCNRCKPNRTFLYRSIQEKMITIEQS